MQVRERLAHEAEYECDSCHATWSQVQQRTECPRCKSQYATWMNFAQWFKVAVQNDGRYKDAYR